VTEILQSCGLTRDYTNVPERYRLRGTAMHEAIAMYLDGLAVDDLAPELQPGMDAFRDFEVKEGYVSLHSELALVHPYGFVGHLDLVGELKGLAILDAKYSESPDLKAAALQLAGYRLLWDVQRQSVGGAKQCYVLQLSPKFGTYKLHPVADAQSELVFLAALTVHQAKEKRPRG
jgi:hypothetical protein